MNIQEEYSLLADAIKRLRERAAKLPEAEGGEVISKIAAGMLVYHLRAAECEAKSIVDWIAKEGTKVAGQ